MKIPFENFQSPDSVERWTKSQEPIAEELLKSNKRVVMLSAPTGCHAKNAEILMYDGTIKKVQDIQIGEYLMGDDSTSRQVLQLHRGSEAMYKVIPVKGESFYVNENHILSLKKTGITYTGRNNKRIRSVTSGQIVNISVKDYLIETNNFKHVHKLYRVPIDFAKYTRRDYNERAVELPLDPYFLGIAIGDGSMGYGQVAITTSEEVLLVECRKIAYELNLKSRIAVKKDNPAVSYYFSKQKGDKKGKNALVLILEKLGLFGCTAGNKFIPYEYKTSIHQDRLEILAGLLDTDGYCNGASFEFSSKSKILANDVAFISRSLGLAAYIEEMEKYCQAGGGGIYYRVQVSGDCSIIPTRIKRKQATERKQVKSVLVTGFKVEKVNDNQDYYGFNISGNHLYCMADFTVTHNCGKSLIMAMIAKYTAPIINYVCSDKALQHQLLADFPEAVVLKGRGNYVCNLFPHLNADSCVGKCEEYKEGDIDCNYYDQKDLMLAADFRILNTHYILYEMNYAGQLKGQQLIILDEADTLDLLFIGFVSLQVTDSQVKRYNLGPLPKLTVVESWIEWAGEAIDKLKQSHDIKNASHALDERYIKANKLIKKLELFLLLVQDDWIYNRHATYSEFKPVWITKDLIKKYLFDHSQRFILCSASLPPKEVICDTLQIDITDCDYIEVGSSFKPENRKVYYDPIMDMSYKNRDKYYIMMDAVKAVMDKYPNVKGIIHCNSYVLGKQIMGIEEMVDEKDKRLLTHTNKNKDEMLKLFMESDKPTVFVSPSCMRGLSLKDDLCRFGICVKMPFLNTQDKAISARLYGSGQRGKIWYNSEAGQAVLQMAGRGVRHFNDYCDFWILDSCFGRVKRTLPKWFTEHIIQDFDYGDDDEAEKLGESGTIGTGQAVVSLGTSTVPIQSLFDKNMTIDGHSQESAPGALTPDVVAHGKPVVKDEDYYDY